MQSPVVAVGPEMIATYSPSVSLGTGPAWLAPMGYARRFWMPTLNVQVVFKPTVVMTVGVAYSNTFTPCVPYTLALTPGPSRALALPTGVNVTFPLASTCPSTVPSRLGCATGTTGTSGALTSTRSLHATAPSISITAAPARTASLQPPRRDDIGTPVCAKTAGILREQITPVTGAFRSKRATRLTKYARAADRSTIQSRRPRSDRNGIWLIPQYQPSQHRAAPRNLARQIPQNGSRRPRRPDTQQHRRGCAHHMMQFSSARGWRVDHDALITAAQMVQYRIRRPFRFCPTRSVRPRISGSAHQRCIRRSSREHIHGALPSNHDANDRFRPRQTAAHDIRQSPPAWRSCHPGDRLCHRIRVHQQYRPHLPRRGGRQIRGDRCRRQRLIAHHYHEWQIEAPVRELRVQHAVRI